jgi:protease IV
LANLERYDTQYVKRSLSSSELFWKELFGQASVFMDGAFKTKTQSPFMNFVKELTVDLDTATKFNDPMGVYSFCLECSL